MPLVDYTEPRIHVCRGNRVNGHQIEFEFHPGATNEVPQDVWDHLTEHSNGVKTLLARGKLRVVKLHKVAPPAIQTKPTGKLQPVSSSPAKTKGGDVEVPGEEHTPETISDVDITEYTAFDAVAFIEKVYNVEALNGFMLQEKNHPRKARKKVLEAIEKQLGIMATDVTKQQQDDAANRQ